MVSLGARLQPAQGLVVLRRCLRQVRHAVLDAAQRAVEHKGVVRQQLPAQHAPQPVHVQLAALPQAEQLRACERVLACMPGMRGSVLRIGSVACSVWHV